MPLGIPLVTRAMGSVLPRPFLRGTIGRWGSRMSAASAGPLRPHGNVPGGRGVEHSHSGGGRRAGSDAAGRAPERPAGPVGEAAAQRWAWECRKLRHSFNPCSEGLESVVGARVLRLSPATLLTATVSNGCLYCGMTFRSTGNVKNPIRTFLSCL